MSNTLIESKKAFHKSHLQRLAELLETCKTASEAEAITARIEELSGWGGVQ